MNAKDNTKRVNDVEILTRYERAQMLFRGLGSIDIVRNGTVFPFWIGETNSFWYARSFLADGKEGRDYRLVNAETGSNISAFDHDALAGLLSEATAQLIASDKLPISDIDIELNPVIVHFTAFNKSWRYADKSKCLEVIHTYPKSWVLSPDGSQAVLVRGYNLWLRNLQNGQERSLTTDGEKYYDYAGSSTMWGLKPSPNLVAQVLWSPDGKTLFTLQKDRRQVKTIPVVHHIPADGSLRPQVSENKIAYPGDNHIEEYRLLTIDVESGRQQSINYGRVPVIQNSNRGFFTHGYGWWCPDSRQAYFIDMDRYYQRVRVVALDTKTGTTRVVLEETSKTQIALAGNENLPHSMTILPETDELIWYSERSGFAHFYLYDLKTGALKKKLTSGEWRVRNGIRFDFKRRELFLSTSGREIGRNPYYRDLVRVNIDTGEMVTVVEGNYEHITLCPTTSTAVYAGHSGLNILLCNGVSATGDYAVVTRSRVDTVPETILVDRNGQHIMVLETAELSLPDGWEWPEPVQMIAADGETDIYGVIYKPAHFDPNKSYPVIDAALAYNSVSSWLAKGSFSNSGAYGGNFYYEAALAQLGFIVVQIDGRGTAYRSKAYQDASYGSYEDGNKLDDHVAGIQQLVERYPYMDKSRMGIVSLVAGSAAAMGLLKYPDFYTVGAGIQVYDSRLMPSIVGEHKFIGPEGRAPNTKALEDCAANLKGKLLQCIGLLVSGDSPPASTLRIINALQRANKDIDVVIEPNVAMGVSNYQLRRMWDHMVRHLQGNEPPKEFTLSDTSLDGKV